MVPHILVVDQNNSAAQVTRSLMQHVLSTANIEIVSPNMLLPKGCRAAPLDMLIIDPVGINEANMQQLRALQHSQPALFVMVLTSEPQARRVRQLRGLKVDALLEKGDSPAALLSQLRSVAHSFGVGARQTCIDAA